MKLIGSLTFLAFGFLFLSYRIIFKKKNRDYSNNPVAIGTVLMTKDFCGKRWIVRFTDFSGEEVVGMDDVLCASSFHPERHHAPKKNTQEKVYYYPRTGNSRYGVGDKSVNYYIHFCDETLYELANERDRKARISGTIIGIILIILGLIIRLQ